MNEEGRVFSVANCVYCSIVAEQYLTMKEEDIFEKIEDKVQ